MNSDEIKSLVARILIVALTALAASLHQSFGAANISALATDLADLIVLGYGIYQHWNMKKVPENSSAVATGAPLNIGARTALGKVVGALAGFLILGGSVHGAHAQTGGSAQTVLKAISQSLPCTPTSCTGPYVGAFMAGNGASADIVGQGLNGSVFAGGGMPGIAAGYQFANAGWFLAAEAGLGYQVSVGTAVNGVGSNERGLMGYQIAKVGGSLSALFGTASPINIGATLTDHLISPYVLMGAVERPFATGWASGAGATFDIAPHLFLDIRYMYVNYGVAQTGALSFNAENFVSAGFNYKF